MINGKINRKIIVISMSAAMSFAMFGMTACGQNGTNKQIVTDSSANPLTASTDDTTISSEELSASVDNSTDNSTDTVTDNSTDTSTNTSADGQGEISSDSFDSNEATYNGEYDNVDISKIDTDLTILSSTMVYSEVYNMINYPENYVGKVVKMKGPFAIYTDMETGKIYYACIISDATACCVQGIEFLLADEHKYPEDYPELDSEITVTGVFKTYEEGNFRYCELVNAVMEY